MKIALAGIVRDEFPYILEWIAYHKRIGIDYFIIANHGSTDGTTELLEALQKLGILTTFYISGETDSPQLPAYNKILKNYGSKYDWIGVMDADEFFVPEENTSLRQILKKQNDDVGAVAFNLKSYGSSFQNYPDHFLLPSPVSGRFIWRAEKDFPINFYVKSFINTKALKKDSIFMNPNAINLKKGYKYVNVLGEDLEFDINNPSHKTKNVIWEKAYINHYIIKSKWEFTYKKLPRGLADNPRGVYRDWMFFKANNTNDVFDPMPFQLQQQRDNQINDLKNDLRELGYSYPLATSQNARPLLEFNHEIEECIKKNSSIRVKGWMYERFEQSNQLDLNIYIEDNQLNRFYPTKIISILRPDVIKRLNVGEEKSRINKYLGFEILFEDIPKDDHRTYKLFAKETGYVCDLDFK